MFQFPPSPTPGQTFAPAAGVTFRWNGTAWYLISGLGVSNEINATNRIINGKFAIDQRNAGVTKVLLPGIDEVTVDRWRFNNNSTNAQLRATRNIDTDGTFYLAGAVQTGGGALTALQIGLMQHRIEGMNLADCAFGLAKASPITFAFDCATSVAGNFSVAFSNAAGTRSYVAPFTMSAPATFETKVFTVPGDTTGTWAKDNTNGMSITFPFGAGTSFHAPTGNVWNAANYTSLATNTNLMGTTDAYILLRNVRLYKGAVDYGPDQRLYAEELALCQRYYWKTFAQGTVPASGVAIGALFWQQWIAGSVTSYQSCAFPVAMRAAPTVTFYNPVNAGNQAVNASTTVNCTSTISLQMSESRAVVSTVSAAGSGNTDLLGVHLTASAEL